MNNTSYIHIYEFLRAIRSYPTAHGPLMTALRRKALCPELTLTRNHLRISVPTQTRLSFGGFTPGQELICIAGTMVFSFSFDDTSVITSKTAVPLVSEEPNDPLLKRIRNVDLSRLKDIQNDLFNAGSWREYKNYIPNERLTEYERKTWDENFNSIADPIQTDVDPDNAKLFHPQISFRGLNHINENAHFFKLLIQIGIPSPDYINYPIADKFSSGIVSARLITIKMFHDCQETETEGGFIKPRLTTEKEGLSAYVITRKGLVCTALNGAHFLILGFKEDTGGFSGIKEDIDLAIPF